ncbi:T9SS type A sorting domain-containing protein [bacterium]|nr:T9SS type A sorting domain-containing protein [bacterium]
MRTYETNSIRSNFSAMMILIAVLLLNISAAIAQVETKITADDAAEGDYFGNSVSISGDYAVVAAYQDDDGENSGSAYVFEHNADEWTQVAKLTAADAAADDLFGCSVSISGDYAVISTPYNGDNGDYSGSAYIFTHEGDDWTQQAKLTATDAAEYDHFGWSVSISGDLALIGAFWDDDDGEKSGSAYIFVRDGTDWTQQAKLTANDAAPDDRFGYSVSISGYYAVVGARGDDDDGEWSGSAYIFVRDGTDWTQQAKLTADDADANDVFGCSVSISGDYAVVGACGDDDDGELSGSAYIFAHDGDDWTQQAKLTADDAAERDEFGWSVSISGDYAVIGADRSGSAYIFAREGADWTQQAKLTAVDEAVDDLFGHSVSINGDYVLVGAHGNDDAGERSGSAYIYNLGENSIEWRGEADIPVDFGIVSAYPNPFNSTTSITYGLDKSAPTRLTLYDLSGQQVTTLFEGYKQAGFHTANLSANDLPSGLYFIQLEASNQVFTQKVMLIR